MKNHQLDLELTQPVVAAEFLSLYHRQNGPASGVFLDKEVGESYNFYQMTEERCGK